MVWPLKKSEFCVVMLYNRYVIIGGYVEVCIILAERSVGTHMFIYRYQGSQSIILFGYDQSLIFGIV